MGTPSSWRAFTTLACWPAQRAKKSDSAPVALTVSMFCSPAVAMPCKTAVSETTRRLTSARWRETARSARRLASAKTTVSAVRSRS